jgi:hypothetical protein
VSNHPVHHLPFDTITVANDNAKGSHGVIVTYLHEGQPMCTMRVEGVQLANDAVLQLAGLRGGIPFTVSMP